LQCLEGHLISCNFISRADKLFQAQLGRTINWRIDTQKQLQKFFYFLDPIKVATYFSFHQLTPIFATSPSLETSDYSRLPICYHFPLSVSLQLFPSIKYMSCYAISGTYKSIFSLRGIVCVRNIKFSPTYVVQSKEDYPAPSLLYVGNTPQGHRRTAFVLPVQT